MRGLFSLFSFFVSITCGAQSSPAVFGASFSFSPTTMVGQDDSSTETNRTKVRLSDAKLNILPAGYELVVEVDESCANPSHFSVENLDGIRSHLVRVSSNVRFQELQAWANSDNCILRVGNNVPGIIQAQVNDPDAELQKHHANIHTLEAYDTFFDQVSGLQDDVIIAIIDTGVELTHDDLKDALWTNAEEVPNNGIDDDRNGYIDDVHGYNFAARRGDPSPQNWPGPTNGQQAHGTFVAGLVAAKANNGIGVFGVNGYKARLMVLNVFGISPSAMTNNIDDAIRYAADMGAKIINMSFDGSGRAETTGDAIRYAVSKGAIVVVAAGNDNADISTHFYTPASFAEQIDGMLAVGAIDSQTNERCSFSNFSPTGVEIAAPGCSGIYSTSLNNGYKYLNGTSMSSPLVAGAASLAYGLIKSRTHMDPKPASIKKLLKAAGKFQENLLPFFSDGKILDLLRLANHITMP